METNKSESKEKGKRGRVVPRLTRGFGRHMGCNPMDTSDSKWEPHTQDKGDERDKQ